MTETLLDVRNVSLGFQGDKGFAHVLDGVGLTVKSSEIMGLVGESGCGKTTLARTVLGILPRHSLRVMGGSVRFQDTDMLDPAYSDLQQRIRGSRITFVPQDPFTSFNPVFTIGEQIDDLMKWKSPRRDWNTVSSTPTLLQRYSRSRRIEDREAVIAMLNSVQLAQPERMLKKYPHEVSGGQRQRLMIAMALLPEPDLIIADEPTTALDVTIQAQILGLLRRLANERGVAVLLATHDLGAAYEICDRITVMYAGQDVETAPVASFFNVPAHPYTNKLLASVPGLKGDMTGIPGEVPDFYSPPPGCRFAPRCERAVTACAVRPAQTETAADHVVSCVNPVTSHAVVAEIPSGKGQSS